MIDETVPETKRPMRPSDTASGRRIWKLVAKALHDYSMLGKNDSVLIGASGGKDSTTLILDLAERKRHGEISCRVEAVHIASEFSSPDVRKLLTGICGERDVPLHILDISVQERLKPGRKMNCYWCSTQRRTELLRFACDKGFAKIALGHHLDDILETFFMNMLAKAEISTMPPVMRYDRYPVTIIRPLALVEESSIREYIGELGLERHVCTCTWNDNSYRDEIRERLEALTKGTPAAKYNIFNSMKNIRSEYLC